MTDRHLNNEAVQIAVQPDNGGAAHIFVGAIQVRDVTALLSEHGFHYSVVGMRDGYLDVQLAREVDADEVQRLLDAKP